MKIGQGNVSSRVHPGSTASQSEHESRSTSPLDSVILDDFNRQPEGTLNYMCSNSGGTRRFRIQPVNRRMLFDFI